LKQTVDTKCDEPFYNPEKTGIEYDWEFVTGKFQPEDKFISG